MTLRPLTLLALALLVSAAQAATPLDALIKPEEGSACFTRVYDEAHLKRNPRQKTTSMTVWLKYQHTVGGAQGLSLGLGLAISQRGDAPALFAQGGCAWQQQANRDIQGRRIIPAFKKAAGADCNLSARPDVFDVLSAEEGGYLILDRGSERETLMVYLDEGLTMVRRADRDKQLYIELGADDRTFLLRRTDIKGCAVVEDAVTTPEPGVHRGNVDPE